MALLTFIFLTLLLTLSFDKVWHKELLYKLKKNLSDQLYLIMRSYLSERYFQAKIDYKLSAYHLIRAGVPQSSILGPVLYLIFTADVPLTENTLMATFADDSNNVIRPRSYYVLSEIAATSQPTSKLDGAMENHS
jgi:hypothetical protein